MLNTYGKVSQYVLVINSLTLRVKRWVLQSFLSFDFMDRTLKCEHLMENL